MTVFTLLHCLPPPGAGTVALQRCDDDMRLLQLEVAELQRRLSATHKTAPDVVSYDRQIAALKADVLRARREAEGLGAALEAPRDCRDSWRMLPGKLPSREELGARLATIEERLAARKDLAVQARGAPGAGGAAGMHGHCGRPSGCLRRGMHCHRGRPGACSAACECTFCSPPLCILVTWRPSSRLPWPSCAACLPLMGSFLTGSDAQGAPQP